MCVGEVGGWGGGVDVIERNKDRDTKEKDLEIHTKDKRK